MGVNLRVISGGGDKNNQPKFDYSAAFVDGFNEMQGRDARIAEQVKRFFQSIESVYRIPASVFAFRYTDGGEKVYVPVGIGKNGIVRTEELFTVSDTHFWPVTVTASGIGDIANNVNELTALFLAIARHPETAWQLTRAHGLMLNLGGADNLRHALAATYMFKQAKKQARKQAG